MKFHKHHIIPRHAGGTDDPSNLIWLTIPEHAAAHWHLYEQYGRQQDKIAALLLTGMITFKADRRKKRNKIRSDQTSRLIKERAQLRRLATLEQKHPDRCYGHKPRKMPKVDSIMDSPYWNKQIDYSGR